MAVLTQIPLAGECLRAVWGSEAKGSVAGRPILRIRVGFFLKLPPWYLGNLIPSVKKTKNTGLQWCDSRPMSVNYDLIPNLNLQFQQPRNVVLNQSPRGFPGQRDEMY